MYVVGYVALCGPYVHYVVGYVPYVCGRLCFPMWSLCALCVPFVPYVVPMCPLW